jgi:diguanylate cyclase
MQLAKPKHRLRLVEPLLHMTTDASAKTAAVSPVLPPRTSDYYRRIEAYAQRIRASGNVTDIINILDEALTETRALGADPRARKAAASVQRTEREIEALQIELRQLRGLVHIDHLTGTLNRSGLELSYKRESARADRNNAPLGVALLDIDDFKRLNDRHGHQAGDAALVHLADVIRRTVRPSDVVVRFGGEEFLFLLPDSETAQAAHALHRLQYDLNRHPLVYRGEEIALTFSAGVTVRRHGQSRDAVIAAADHALYAAKRAGKCRVMAADGI